MKRTEAIDLQAENGWTSHWWESSDGLRLHARDYNALATAHLPVVCLHGLTRNARDFEDFAPLLASQGRRVIVPEMRGRGQSAYDPEPGNYHFATYAEDVARLLDDLTIERALFIGTSMGGVITLFLSDLRPELVAGAVLNDIGPEVSPKGIERIAAYVGKAPVVTDWPSAVGYAQTISSVNLPDLDKADWLRHARRMFREDPAGVPVLDYDLGLLGGKITPFTAPEELWGMFETLARRSPVAVLRGALSDILSPEILERMASRAPALQVSVIPGVGHAPLLDEPVALAAINAFLT